jgi:hypothetical protein
MNRQAISTPRSGRRPQAGPGLNAAPYSALELRAVELFANGMRPMRAAQLGRQRTI